MKLNGRPHVSALLGPDGRPLDRSAAVPDHVRAKTALFSAFGSYIEALSQTRAPATSRARDPLSNHAWVCAAAMAIAQTAASAPLRIYRETGREIARRSATLKARGDKGWATPTRAGNRRRAWERHLSRGTGYRMVAMKAAAEPDWEHPLNDLLSRPNPYQDGVQLQQLTDLYITLRGEMFWVLTDAMGGSPGPMGMPERIWPIAPELFEPRYSKGQYGELIGWWYRVPQWMPNATSSSSGARVPLELDDVVQFKTPNPNDILRGFSRLAPVASAVERDLLLAQHIRTTLANQGVRRGVITYDGEMLDADKEQEYLQRFEEQYEKIDGSGRTAMLTGGFKYTAIAQTLQELQGHDVLDYDKDQIFAVLSTPASVVGGADAANYASEIARDRGFWERTIVPIHRLKERAIEGTLLFRETDDIFAAFDYTGVEAMRAGLDHKLAMAERACSDRLHMPPDVAYQLVGLEVPEYEGRDTALIAGLLSPVKDILEGSSAVAPSFPPPVPPGEGEEPEDPEQTPVGDGGDDGRGTAGGEGEDPAEVGRIRIPRARDRVTKARSRWRDFVRLESLLERSMRNAYRGWVRAQKDETLRAFDRLIRGKEPAIDFAVVVPEEKPLQDALKARSRPTYTKTYQQAFEFTLPEIGVATFEMDDPILMRVLDDRERLLLQGSPLTLRRNLLSTIRAGMQAAETVQQIRLRVGQVFDISASSSKSLLVARTSTAGLMNGVRNEMFGLQGFEEEDWSTAEDEHVRPSHKVYGEAGPQTRGFNYLTLVGKAGTCEYPGDPRAPIAEVANCRCLKLPVG